MLAIDIAVTDLHTYRHCHVCGLLACLACAHGLDLESVNFILEVHHIDHIIIVCGRAETFLLTPLAAVSGVLKNDVLNDAVIIFEIFKR